jgi:hypothetical protein
VPTGVDYRLEAQLSITDAKVEQALLAVQTRERDAIVTANASWAASERLRTVLALTLSTAEDVLTHLLA